MARAARDRQIAHPSNSLISTSAQDGKVRLSSGEPATAMLLEVRCFGPSNKHWPSF